MILNLKDFPILTRQSLERAFHVWEQVADVKFCEATIPPEDIEIRLICQNDENTWPYQHKDKDKDNDKDKVIWGDYPSRGYWDQVTVYI